MTVFRLSTLDLDEVVRDCSADIDSFNGKQIIVTGGSGFVGTWLVESLIRAGQFGMLGDCQIRVINRHATPIQSEWARSGLIELVVSDVRRLEPESVRADYIFHCATPASADLNKKRPEEMYDTIVEGTRALVHSLNGFEGKFVNLSSGAVYGVQHSHVQHLDESAPISIDEVALSAYARGKIVSENLLNEAFDGRGIVVCHARLFAFLAPLLPLDKHFAAGNFIGRSLSNQPIVVTGEPSTVRTYQYGTDLVSSLIGIATRSRASEIFNVGSEHEISISELAYMILDAALKKGLKSDVRFEWDGSRASRYVPSVQKINNLLEIENKISLQESIERTLDWNLGLRK